MFDLSFWEIMVIGIIAVIVVGPERLPGMAYTAGKWITKVKRFVANAKAEVESELNTAELRKMMGAQEEEMQKLRKLLEDTRHDVEQSQQLLAQSVDDAARAVREAEQPAQAAPQSEQAASATTASDTPAAAPVLASSEAALPASSARSIEEEMQLLSQSLGETLHRPSFGASSDTATVEVPPETPAPKANA